MLALLSRNFFSRNAHRKNGPRSRYPFRRKCPLLRSARVSAGLRSIFIADSVQTVMRHLESVRSPRFSRTDSVYYRRDSVYSVADSVRTPCILCTGSVRMLETAERSPISNGLDDARFSPFSVACCLRHRFQTMDRNRKSHMYKHQHTGMMKNKELPHY